MLQAFLLELRASLLHLCQAAEATLRAQAQTFLVLTKPGYCP